MSDQHKWFLRINVSQLRLAEARQALDAAQRATASDVRSHLTRPDKDGFYFVVIHEWRQFDLLLSDLRGRKVKFENRTDNPPKIKLLEPKKEDGNKGVNKLFEEIDKIFEGLKGFGDLFGKPPK